MLALFSYFGGEDVNYDRLIKQLIKDEGNEQFAYQDKFDYWTIGIGRCIDKRKGKGLSLRERLFLLENDIDDWINELREHLSWFDDLDDVRQEILIMMAHQLGINGLMQFVHTLDHMKRGEYKEASIAMLDSMWAKSQTPDRAKRLAKMMETGEYNA
jgi:lysozyme